MPVRAMTGLMKKVALLLAVVIVAGPAALRAEDLKPEDGRLRKALERSLLFPGLGQLYEKQYLKGAILASAELFCLAAVVINAHKGNDAYWRYRGATTPEDAVKWRGETVRLDRRRNTAVLAAAGVWILNMVDIFVYAKGKYGREKSLAFHPFYHHESLAYGAGITCRF